MGEAHATMYIDEANGRLKTRATSFAETSAVIPAQAGIQKFEVAAVLKYFPNAKVWIPACAGMTNGKRRWVEHSCPTYGLG